MKAPQSLPCRLCPLGVEKSVRSLLDRLARNRIRMVALFLLSSMLGPANARADVIHYRTDSMAALNIGSGRQILFSSSGPGQGRVDEFVHPSGNVIAYTAGTAFAKGSLQFGPGITPNTRLEVESLQDGNAGFSTTLNVQARQRSYSPVTRWRVGFFAEFSGLVAPGDTVTVNIAGELDRTPTSSGGRRLIGNLSGTFTNNNSAPMYIPKHKIGFYENERYSSFFFDYWITASIQITKGGRAGTSFAVLDPFVYTQDLSQRPDANVPEPASLVLWGMLALTGLFAARQSRRRSDCA